MDSTQQRKSATAPSDRFVSETIREGFESVVTKGAVGLVLGGMAGIVLSRGGSSSARRVLSGLGAGIGMGSAWTRTSMDIEEFTASLEKK